MYLCNAAIFRAADSASRRAPSHQGPHVFPSREIATTRSSIALDDSAPGRENARELVRRNHLELRVRAIGRLLVRAPPAKLRGVPKACILHVIVRDLYDQLGTERLPREVLV